MKYSKNIQRSLTCFLICSLSLVSGASSALAASPVPAGPLKKEAGKVNAQAKAETKAESTQKASEKRKEVVSEAVSTLRWTQDALTELDDGKTKEALASLEKATGKLEIVLARDPKLALVPIDVRVVSSDLYATVDTVKNARQEAEKLLREGRVQEARAILQNLASETIISTSNLPMATYPAALKKAAKLVDENKTAEAKEVLQTALDTLIVTELVIPIPVVRAQAALAKADKLAKTSNRNAQQTKELNDLVSAADTNIKFAEALGYGKKVDFDSFHKEVDTIRAKTGNGKSGNGIFDQIKSYMESMNKNSQHTSNSK
jgi:hypothetical protein